MKYIIDQKREEQSHNANGKAMSDVFKILFSCGVKLVPGISKDKSKIIRILDFPILVFFCMFKAKKGDYIFYVFKENILKIKIVNLLRKVKGYKTICFIYDVNSIREGISNAVATEFALISAADVILAPNEGSIKYMKDLNIDKPMIPVKVWDYLIEESSIGNEADMDCKEISNGVLHVAYAGNFGKSAFIRELGKSQVVSDKVVYHLWGDIDDEHFFDNYSNVVYEGSVSPRELIAEIGKKCDAGLVWDGEKATEIAGLYGEYMKFNNPHKCGCYLAAGLPVIVWSKSGAAYFVRESGCGWCIDSLSDIGDIARNIDKTVYAATAEVSEKVRKGMYLRETVLTATKGM